MKIHELEQVNEGGYDKAIPLVTNAASSLAKPVSRFFGRIFGSEREELIKDIASLMGKNKWEGEATPLSAYYAAKKLGPKAVEKVRSDSSILGDVSKEVNKARGLTTGSKIVGAAGKSAKGAKVIAGGVAKLTEFGLHAAIAEAILEPLYQYYKVMEVADQYLQQNEIPDEFKSQYKSAEEWYKKYREQQLSGAIAKMAVVLMGVKFAEMPLGVVGNLLAFRFKKTAAVLKFTNVAIGAVLANELKNSSFANGFARVMAEGIMGIPLAGIIGGPTAAALDGILGDAVERAKKNGGKPVAADEPAKTPPAGGSQSTKPPAEQPNAKADKDATSTPAPAAPGKKLSPTGYELAPNASPVEKWIDIGGGYVKDPATGQIANRANLGLQ